MYKPRFKGKHHEMGYRYGALLKKHHVDLTPMLTADKERLAMGKASLELCADIYPEIVAEIEGMAKGLEVDPLAFGTFLITAGAYAFDVGCTTFAYRTGEAVHFVRNHDMFVNLKKTTESALYTPENGYAFLGHGDGLIGKEDGLNAHGLAVGMTFVAPKAVAPGLNFLMMVRMLLEKCRTVDEALDLLARMPTMTSHTLVLADPTGALAAVEMAPGRMAVRTPEEGADFIVATNHFVDPEMVAYDNRPDPNWYGTLDRYDTVVRALTEEIPYTEALGQDIASGRHGFLCQYKRHLKFDTLWSVSYHLNTLSVKRAEGNPMRARYRADNRLKG